MNCRACDRCDLTPLWADGDGFQWHRCRACGSDTSEAAYAPERYGADYVAALLIEDNAPLENHEHNVQAFERHATLPRRLFLDVGSAHGAGRQAMWSAGWETMGFDVSFAGRPPVGLVVAPTFQANLFWQRFDAVLCREALEHVEDGRLLLRELLTVTMPGGLCQITTPRPMKACIYPRCYQRGHLCLWGPRFLTAELERIGFAILETDIWELGQRYVCRRP
jgi:SAM-dependent methyltransferase